jgi:hypothetical protein
MFFCAFTSIGTRSTYMDLYKSKYHSLPAPGSITETLPAIIPSQHVAVLNFP